MRLYTFLATLAGYLGLLICAARLAHGAQLRCFRGPAMGVAGFCRRRDVDRQSGVTVIRAEKNR